jgi:hypothetical protein
MDTQELVGGLLGTLQFRGHDEPVFGQLPAQCGEPGAAGSALDECNTDVLSIRASCCDTAGGLTSRLSAARARLPVRWISTSSASWIEVSFIS